MSYRPICDTWILARSKVQYYGAYPAGFLERARALLGVSIGEPVVHLCSGRVEDYPYDGLGAYDICVDANPLVEPHLVADITKPWSTAAATIFHDSGACAVLADPPYTDADAAKYGDFPLVTARQCLTVGLDLLRPGDRVGILHYVAPRPPKGVKFVALVTVFVGFENRGRLYSVYEK